MAHVSRVTRTRCILSCPRLLCSFAYAGVVLGCSLTDFGGLAGGHSELVSDGSADAGFAEDGAHSTDDSGPDVDADAAIAEPLILARGIGRPIGIAVDDHSVFFTDLGTGSIFKIPKTPASDGSAAVPVAIATGQIAPSAIALDAGNVYWVSSTRIRSVPKGGGVAPKPVVDEDGSNPIFDLVISGPYVFYTSNGFIAKCHLAAFCQRGSGGIYALTVGGGPYVRLTTVPLDSFVYGTSNTGIVVKASTTPTAVTQLAAGQDNPFDVVVDQSTVYWTNHNGAAGAVLSASLFPPDAGPNAPTHLASGGDPTAIVLDATSATLYWIDFATGSILKCAKSGCNGQPTSVVAGQLDPQDLAVNEGYVYWTNASAGTVARIEK